MRLKWLSLFVGLFLSHPLQGALLLRGLSIFTNIRCTPLGLSHAEFETEDVSDFELRVSKRVTAFGLPPIPLVQLERISTIGFNGGVTGAYFNFPKHRLTLSESLGLRIVLGDGFLYGQHTMPLGSLNPTDMFNYCRNPSQDGGAYVRIQLDSDVQVFLEKKLRAECRPAGEFYFRSAILRLYFKKSSFWDDETLVVENLPFAESYSYEEFESLEECKASLGKEPVHQTPAGPTDSFSVEPIGRFLRDQF